MANLVQSNPNGKIGLATTLDYFGSSAIASLADAQYLAAHIGILVITPSASQLGGTHGPWGVPMMTANPSLVVMPYGKSVENGQGNAYGLPEPWYAHTARPGTSGNRINVFSASIYLMLPDQTTSFTDPRSFTVNTWGDWRAQDGLHLISAGNSNMGGTVFRGFYLDSMSTSPKGAVNPATGVAYSNAAFQTLAYGMGDTALAAISGSQMVLGNGLGNGTRYFGGTNDLLNHVDGAIAESWLRSNGSAATAWPSLTTWKQDTNMVIDAETNGKFVWVVVNINNFTSGGSGFTAAPFTTAQLDQWRQFTCASYLISKGSRARFEFVPNTSTIKPVPEIKNNPIYGVDLGAPLESHATITGYLKFGAEANPGGGLVYTRRYANGISIVNPSTTKVTAFALDRTYKKIDGTLVGATIDVLPNTGMVLLTSSGTNYADTGAIAAGHAVPSAASLSAFVDAASITGVAHPTAGDVYKPSGGGSAYVEDPSASVATGVADAPASEHSDYVDAAVATGIAVPDDDQFFTGTGGVPAGPVIAFAVPIGRGGSAQDLGTPAAPSGLINLNPDRERNMLDLLDRIRPVGSLMSVSCGFKSNIKVNTTAPLATSEKFHMSRFVTGTDQVAWPTTDTKGGSFIVAGIENEAAGLAGAHNELWPIFHTIEGVHAYTEKALEDASYGAAASAQDTPPFYDVKLGPPYLQYRSEHIGHYNRQMQLIFPFLQNVQASTDFTAQSAVASQTTPLVIKVRAK